MSLQSLPEYLKPLVGLAMWHLGRINGKLGRRMLPDEVYEVIMAKGEYSTLPQAEIKRAIDRAVLNVGATDATRLLDGAIYERA